jgi:hypothetical protein
LSYQFINRRKLRADRGKLTDTKNSFLRDSEYGFAESPTGNGIWAKVACVETALGLIVSFEQFLNRPIVEYSLQRTLNFV